MQLHGERDGLTAHGAVLDEGVLAGRQIHGQAVRLAAVWAVCIQKGVEPARAGAHLDHRLEAVARVDVEVGRGLRTGRRLPWHATTIPATAGWRETRPDRPIRPTVRCVRRLHCFVLLGALLAPGFARAAVPPVAVTLPEGTIPRPLAATAAQLFFRLDTGADERLWQTSGTPATTHAVWDDSGDELRAPRLIATDGESLYVAAVGGDAGEALFRTDGGVAHRVANVPVRRGFAGTGRLFFTAARAESGESLWLADDLGAHDTGLVLSADSQAVAFGSHLLYAGTGPDGTEPWQTNGVLASQLVDLAPGTAPSGPSDFALVGESATFFSSDATTDTLWRTDGTAAGTSAIRSWPSEPSASPFARAARGFARRLYFRGRAYGNTFALWSSDGTSAGTTALAALDDLSAPMLGAGASWYFVGRHGSGAALYATDGTAAHTVVLVDRAVGALTALGDRVYYPLDDAHLGGTNGTAVGTGSLELPAHLGHVEGAAGIFSVAGQSLYFTTQSDGGTRLWTLPLPASRTDAADAGAADAAAAEPAVAAEEEGCSCKDKGGIFSPLLGLFLFVYSKRRR